MSAIAKLPETSNCQARLTSFLGQRSGSGREKKFSSQLVNFTPGGGGGWGHSIYPLVGKCGAAPHTLTLFKTNIADFPTLFKTEFRFLNGSQY